MTGSPSLFRTHAGPLSATAAIVVLDQVTKAWVSGVIPLHQDISIVDGFLNLVHARNTGVAFSFLANSGSKAVPYLLVVLTACAAVGIIFFMRTLARGSLAAWGAGLLLGGATGNLIERVRLGYVVDFIEMYYKSFHWPAYNVADAAITFGVAFLAIDLLKKPD